MEHVFLFQTAFGQTWTVLEYNDVLDFVLAYEDSGVYHNVILDFVVEDS